MLFDGEILSLPQKIRTIMVGRKQEQKELKRAFESKESEFVMVYGRRRVGKTYLVREFFGDKFVFFCTGIARGTMREELMNFRLSIVQKEGTSDCPVFGNWMEAFERLRILAERAEEKRKVIFLDEVPWMYTQKSDFLKALEHFWNGWACQQHNIVLIVCGSAASWMVKKIVRDKGGLHDRITLPLKIQPFTLSETKEYLVSSGIQWDEKTIAECYMVLGGIPYYLKLLDRSLSLVQNIDRLFFARSAILGAEFPNLYASLFKESRDYVRIVDILSRKKMGYTREEIIRLGSFTDGGGVSEKLADLEECGFIRRYAAKGDAGSLYQLTDYYTAFYYHFIKDGSFDDDQFWMHIQGSPKYNTWKGLSFEKLCFSHLAQIKRALGIEGIWTKAYAYSGEGVQIDMILERADRCVNIVEIKYLDTPFVITPAYAETLKKRQQVVASLYKKRMTYMTVMITAEGLSRNALSSSLIQQELTLDVLYQ